MQPSDPSFIHHTRAAAPHLEVVEDIFCAWFELLHVGVDLCDVLVGLDTLVDIGIKAIGGQVPGLRRAERGS